MMKVINAGYRSIFNCQIFGKTGLSRYSEKIIKCAIGWMNKMSLGIKYPNESSQIFDATRIFTNDARGNGALVGLCAEVSEWLILILIQSR
jgi:hypothetical protein